MTFAQKRPIAAAAAAAVLAVTVSGCGGGSHASSQPPVATTQTTATLTTQTMPTETMPTTQTTQTTRTTTVGNHPRGRRRHRGGGSGSPQGKPPLVRLAITCRSIHPPGGQPPPPGKAATVALATRLAMRAQMMTQAIGAHSSSPNEKDLLAPLRRALKRLLKAAHRASASPTPKTAEALRLAAARLGLASESIGVPECVPGAN